MNILVAGIGNIFQGDDAFGCEVAQRLNRRAWPAGVRVVDFGIRGLDLAYALMDRPDLTILIDAIPYRGEAGTLYTIEPEMDTLESVAVEQVLDTHDMNPLRVLRMAKAMGAELGRVLLVGCEPADLGGEYGRMGLTPPVSAAVVEAASMVEVLIQREVQEATA